MQYTLIFTALTAFFGLDATLPHPSPQKLVPIKAGSLTPTPDDVITRRAIRGGASILKPIKISNAIGKRESIDFSSLDPSNQAHLLYGSPGGMLIIVRHCPVWCRADLPLQPMEMSIWPT